MPNKLLRKIEGLSKRTGVPVAKLVEQSIALYEKRIAPPVTNAGKADRYEELMSDPEVRRIYGQVSEAIGLRSSASLTAAQLKARGAEGGAARAKNLTKERRTEIAIAAGKASAEKRAARKLAAERSSQG